jgi:hypothetical protein
MGRQIAIIMTETDEKLFLDFLSANYEFTLVFGEALSAENAENRFSNCFDDISKGRKYYIWNKKFSWTPQYKQNIYGNYYISNTEDVPLIEFVRQQSIPKAHDYGRLYLDTNGLKYSENIITEDIALINAFYNELVRWIKKNAVRKIGHKSWYTYILPNADRGLFCK